MLEQCHLAYTNYSRPDTDMAVNREETSSPLDLSKKPVIVTSGDQKLVHIQPIPGPKRHDSRALDLTKVTPPVSFHRAIPVTTTVPSHRAQKSVAASGMESRMYSSPSKRVDRELGGVKVSLPTVVNVDTSSTSSPVQKLLVRPMHPVPGSRQRFLVSHAPKDVIVTAAETTSTTREMPGGIRLSPNMLTLQQQSAMRNFVDMDRIERTRSPHGGVEVTVPSSSGRPSVVPGTGFIWSSEASTGSSRIESQDIDMARLSMAPTTTTSDSRGKMVVIPISDLHKLGVKGELVQLPQDRGPPPMQREVPPPASKGKESTTGREGKHRVHLAPHFQPYPIQRPPASMHRSASIPNLAIQTMALDSTRLSSAESSVSPGVITQMVTMPMTLPSAVIQGWSSGTSSRAESPVPTYALLGKPQVATVPSTQGDDQRGEKKAQLEQVLQGQKSPPVPTSSAEVQRQVASLAAAAAAASGTTEGTSGQGSLSINPFYPLSVAVDCHRATAQDSDGDTPLHIAIVQETTDLAYIQRLIHLVKMSGKSLDIFNYMQQTPLHLAAITNNIEVIRIMLEAGADPNEADRNGQTTVHHACYNRNSPCMHVIFKYSTTEIDLEKRNFNGHTPLHVAVEKYDKVLVRMLLEHGANVNAMDSRNGWTPLFIAVANQDIKMIGILVEFLAKVNAQSYSGNSALHIATGRGYTDVVKALVQYGADLSLKNSHWDTPVNVANANEMNLLLRGICRGSPTMSLSAQSFASEKNSSPGHQPAYLSSYSPPPHGGLTRPLSSSHDDVRSALSNKILHRKLSRDSASMPTSPVPELDSASARKKFKTTKVVKVTVDGDTFPLGQIIPMSEGNKIPVIMQTKTPRAQDTGDTPVLSADSGIGSWRVDSDPSLRLAENNTRQEAVRRQPMDTGVEASSVGANSTVAVTPSTAVVTLPTMDVSVSSSSGQRPSDHSLGFTVQPSYHPFPESVRVPVGAGTPLAGLRAVPRETYEKMEVDDVGPAIAMKTVDGSAFRFEHMFGTPVAAASSLELSPSAKEGRIELPSLRDERVTQTETEARPAKVVVASSSSSDFDVTAVPVYRKAMQNGQQMSRKFKEMNALSEGLTTSMKVSSASSGIKRQSSQDSDDEGKLVIVEKGEMRTRPLKKTVSMSCPTSPSQQREVPKQELGT